MRTRSLFVIALSLAFPRAVHANGRFPSASQLVASPRDPTFLALRTTFGILVSHDAAQSWQWICETAIGYGSTVQDPPLGLTQTGFLAGTTRGLAVSPDDGCSWSFVLNDPVIDVVVRRDASGAGDHEALVLTSVYDTSNNSYLAKVLASINDGKTWAQQGVTLPSDILVETIELAKSDPHRIYVSGTRTQILDSGMPLRIGVILTSKDDGAHYTESTIDLAQGGNPAPFLAAVDPLRADRVYVRVSEASGSRIVISDDGATNFRTVYTGQSDLLGFALAADGSRVYVGGPRDGLLVASSSAPQFEKKVSVAIRCLTNVGDTLYACTDDARSYQGQLLQVSNDHGDTLTPKFHLSCVQGALACPPSSPTGQCGASFASVVRTALGPSQCDSGDAGADASDIEDAGAPSSDASTSPPAPRARSGCGCSSGSAGAGSSAFATFAVAFAFMFRRKAKARRHKANQAHHRS